MSCCGTFSPWVQFKQQRLPAWQPLLSPAYIAMLLLAVSLVFTPLGTIMSYANTQAQEVTIPYHHINRCTSTHNTKAFTYTGNGATLHRGCLTEVSFELKSTLKAPVYLYYGLTRFYQNHRRFAESMSHHQLAGKSVSSSDLSTLAPLAHVGDHAHDMHTPLTYGDSVRHYGNFIYSPAGLIPWSMFNDTFVLYKGSDTTRELICNSSAFSRVTNEPLQATMGGANQCKKKGIAWTTDVEHKFKPISFEDASRVWSAPRSMYGEPVVASNDSFFANGWYAGELGHDIPVSTDEDLMVWARTASMPTFRKLHRVIEVDLEPGWYTMQVGEHYDTVSFDGQKSFTLATTSWFGGKNIFLAVMYLAIGGVALASAIGLLAVRHYVGDRALIAVGVLVDTCDEKGGSP